MTWKFMIIIALYSNHADNFRIHNEIDNNYLFNSQIIIFTHPIQILINNTEVVNKSSKMSGICMKNDCGMLR